MTFALRGAADDSGLSLNEFCARKLAAPGSTVAGPMVDAVGRAAAGVGDSLVGVVAFGSWARGEATEASDIDLLVVVENRVPIRRELYRSWDESPLEWEGHRVEPAACPPCRALLTPPARAPAPRSRAPVRARPPTPR